MPLIERIQERLFQLVPGDSIELFLELAADRFFELAERLHAERARELIVRLRLDRLGDLLHGHIENSVFPGEVLGLIVLGKGDADLAVLACLRPLKPLFETWNETLGANDDKGVLARAALEGLAVHAPLEVDGQPVAYFRRA